MMLIAKCYVKLVIEKRAVINHMKERLLEEQEIVDLIVDYLINKENGQWHLETLKKHELHDSGADIDIRGGKKNTERFIIECKKKSHAKSANSINREGWLTALGQLISRMEANRIISSGKNKGEPNRATKYGLGLYWVGAQVALRRIPRNVAKTLNLYVFSVDEYGFVKQFSPKDFGKEKADYPDSLFHN